MAARVATVQSEKTVRLYYLGGLVPMQRKKRKRVLNEQTGKIGFVENIVPRKAFTVTAGDKTFKFENKFGAFVEMPALHARVITRNHKIVNEQGMFEAFTTQLALINQIKKRREQTTPQTITVDTLASATKEQLLERLMEVEDAETFTPQGEETPLEVVEEEI